MNLGGVVADALGEMTNRRLQNHYQRDFQSWKADVLGIRTYEKMAEIGDTILFGEIPRSLVKSSNGVSKSYEISAMIAWAASVFNIGETLSIVSAPTVNQIDRVIWRYLKNFHARAASRGRPLPGKLNEAMGWKVFSPSGNIDLAFGRKPADQDAVSAFQGTRSSHGMTYVWFDEAGGMSRDMFTAAEAVMTGAKARFTGLGNPDHSSGEFYNIFTNPKYKGEYNFFTISSYDLPAFTGEVVYPDDPEMEAVMLSALTTRAWVEHKKRTWGEQDARFRAKVLGEFSETAGNGFFSAAAITKSLETEIDEDLGRPAILGVDVARWGQDESVIYLNRGGRLRLFDSWGKSDLVDSARRVHRAATDCGAAEVRIDASGVGGGVFDMLDRLGEFSEKTYLLIAIDGGASSPDPTQWSNRRAYNHDSLRQQMVEGLIDIDFEDEDLRDQLEIVTYKFNSRGGVQITPKDDMKTEMGGSPDRLDAAIYATVDLEWLTGNPMGRMRPGDVLTVDPLDVEPVVEWGLGSVGWPL